MFGPVLLGLLDLDEELAARTVGEEHPAVRASVCTFEPVPMQLTTRS